MSLARKPVYAQRRFVVAPYSPDQDGRLHPARPKRCWSDGEASCRVSFHKWRPRKCGVGHPLACFRCSVHHCFFPVYPPGWSPYGRRTLVHVTPTGEDVMGLSVDVSSWGDSAFGASVDASRRWLWPLSFRGFREFELRYGHRPYGVRRTQMRHVEGVLRLFALFPDQESERPAVAAWQGIDLTLLAQAASRPRDGPPLVVGGAQGVAILSAIGRPRRGILPGMNRLGVAREYWGAIVTPIFGYRR